MDRRLSETGAKVTENRNYHFHFPSLLLLFFSTCQTVMWDERWVFIQLNESRKFVWKVSLFISSLDIMTHVTTQDNRKLLTIWYCTTWSKEYYSVKYLLELYFSAKPDVMSFNISRNCSNLEEQIQRKLKESSKRVTFTENPMRIEVRCWAQQVSENHQTVGGLLAQSHHLPSSSLVSDKPEAALAGSTHRRK